MARSDGLKASSVTRTSSGRDGGVGVSVAFVMQSIAGHSKKEARVTPQVTLDTRLLVAFAAAVSAEGLEEPANSSLDWAEGQDHDVPIVPHDCFAADDVIGGLVCCSSLPPRVTTLPVQYGVNTETAHLLPTLSRRSCHEISPNSSHCAVAPRRVATRWSASEYRRSGQLLARRSAEGRGRALWTTT